MKPTAKRVGNDARALGLCLTRFIFQQGDDRLCHRRAGRCEPLDKTREWQNARGMRCEKCEERDDAGPLADQVVADFERHWNVGVRRVADGAEGEHGNMLRGADAGDGAGFHIDGLRAGLAGERGFLRGSFRGVLPGCEYAASGVGA